LSKLGEAEGHKVLASPSFINKQRVGTTAPGLTQHSGAGVRPLRLPRFTINNNTIARAFFLGPSRGPAGVACIAGRAINNKSEQQQQMLGPSAAPGYGGRARASDMSR